MAKEISFITDEDCKLQDNAKLIFGDGADRNSETAGDVYMYFDGTDMHIASASASTTLKFDIDTVLRFGAQANTAGSGIPLDATDTSGLAVYTDDDGASIADSVRGMQSRLLLTVDQTGGSIRALQGQLKMAAGVDVTSGVYTAVQGYVEMAGTHITKTGSTHSCIDASLEIGTALTIDSGGEFFGLHVETTGAGTITNNGTCAAIGIDKASGAASWPVGIQINCDSVVRGVQVGTLGSNITSGVPIANAASINGFYCDDNGADQTTSTVWRNVTARTYFSVNQTLAAADYYVLRGHLKAASGVDFGGATSVKAATNSYVELAGATTVGAGSFFAGHFAEIWIDGNLTATGKVAGVMSRCYSSGASTFGNYAAAFMATKQWASTDSWPVALYVDAADYVLYAPTGTAYECGFKIGSMTSVGGGDGNAADGVIRVMVGSTAYYIALYAAGSLTGE